MNKGFTVFMLLATSISFNTLSANPKTWIKDENGRVLIYRAEPSKVAGIIFGVLTGAGLGISSAGFLPGIPSRERFSMIVGFGVLGSFVSIPSAIAFKYLYYDECNALYKPLIIIDKYGIAYEGHAKILWKNVCGYRSIQNIVYGKYGPIDCGYSLEISTDVDRLEIPENRMAITWQKLYQLIDEAYKSYKELEKEKVVA